MFTNQLQRPVLGMLLIAFEMYPVVESMRARKPGLQAPNNLAGFQDKKAHIFLIFLKVNISQILQEP